MTPASAASSSKAGGPAKTAAPAGALRFAGEQLGARLPPLLVAAERVAATVAQGVHGRRRSGQGDSFWQFRPYEAGDAATRIDWRESGKSQRLFVRENEWEAAQSVWLWRDFSPSMDYASTRALPTKQARADLLTVALGALLVRGGERTTLLGSGLSPQGGRPAVSRLVDIMERQARTSPGLGATGTGASGAPSLPVFEPLVRHAQVVMLGDLLSPLEEMAQLIGKFAATGVRGHLLQVLDPAEESLPFDGRVRFEGLEAEEPILISRVESIRAAYRDRLARHRDGLMAIARRAGWTFAIHHTDRPATAALLALWAAMAARPGG